MLHPLPSITIVGFTLLELCITLAILGLLAAFAVTSYQGYLQTTYLSVARMNAQSLHLFLEDHYIQHASYIIDNKSQYTKPELQTYFGWQPNGDNNQYTYTVSVTSINWDIIIEHTSGHWLRCEERMRHCCDSDTTHATKIACP